MITIFLRKYGLVPTKYIVYRYGYGFEENKSRVFKVEDENETEFKIISPHGNKLSLSEVFICCMSRKWPEIRYNWVKKNSPLVQVVFTCRNFKTMPA